MEGFTPWRAAMSSALYGPDGFFVRPGATPAHHFRTSVHASALFAAAVVELLERVDAALGHPDAVDFVDVGAGGGELAAAVAASGALSRRLRVCAVELGERPRGLDPAIRWSREVPPCTGLLFANEWLDNVPVDVVQIDDSGRLRQVLVSPEGEERLGGDPEPADVAWLRRWWPLDESGERARPGQRGEPGWTRDEAWRSAVAQVERGLAVAVDYGHLRQSRPFGGSLTGYAGGRQVPPVPDGSCDLTAHVAVDSLAGGLVRQRDALRALGVSGARPPIALASTDPAAYLRALSAAGEAGELLDPAGLGGFWWVGEPVGLPSLSELLGG